MSFEKKCYSRVGMMSEDEDATSPRAVTSEGPLTPSMSGKDLDDEGADEEDAGEETDASGDESFSRRPRLTPARAARKCVLFFCLSLVMGVVAGYAYAYFAAQSGIGTQWVVSRQSISP